MCSENEGTIEEHLVIQFDNTRFKNMKNLELSFELGSL